MGKTLEQFKRELQRLNSTRKNTPVHSVGVRQAFLFLQSRKWKDVGKPVTEKQFQQIVRKVNERLGKLFIEKKELTFPCSMGKIEIRITKSIYYDRDGKLVLPKKVNWDATLKLWYEDKEAFENRFLVRDSYPKQYKLIYDRTNAAYNNKGFFDFSVNRNILRTLASMLREGNLETFMYGTVR